jgi:hypothetical protein
MVVSLILGIGSLSYERAGKLAVSGGIVLVASWLAFIIIFLMPYVFPSVESGFFYSASLVEAAHVDFIDHILGFVTNAFGQIVAAIMVQFV